MQAFRLTSMADLLLNGKPPEPAGNTHSPPSRGTQFVAPTNIDVSEQGELLLLSSAENWPAIELIERFAQAQGVRSGQLCYRLTAGSLGEAFKRRESFAPLLELLRRAAGAAEADGREQRSLMGACACIRTPL
ncbi:MAG: hypothetical protein NVS3B14_03540 [Ktedonobacteraceae bacterium]